jgi:hypothetical protein
VRCCWALDPFLAVLDDCGRPVNELELREPALIVRFADANAIKRCNRMSSSARRVSTPSLRGCAGPDATSILWSASAMVSTDLVITHPYAAFLAMPAEKTDRIYSVGLPTLSSLTSTNPLAKYLVLSLYDNSVLQNLFGCSSLRVRKRYIAFIGHPAFADLCNQVLVVPELRDRQLSLVRTQFRIALGNARDSVGNEPASDSTRAITLNWIRRRPGSSRIASIECPTLCICLFFIPV